jgi:uncharacterized delta-60 repeat protein
MKKNALFTLVFLSCFTLSYSQPGELDPSFGSNGIVRADLGATYESGPHGNTHFTKTAIQNDGKIVAAGYTWNGSSFVSILTRYNTDGSIDTTFNKTGILITGGSLKIRIPGQLYHQ